MLVDGEWVGSNMLEVVLQMPPNDGGVKMFILPPIYALLCFFFLLWLFIIFAFLKSLEGTK